MSNNIKIMYGVSMAIVIVMLFIFGTHIKSEEIVYREEQRCEILTDYTLETYSDESAPLGIVQEYSWTLEDVPQKNGVVAFYVIHQEVEIYVGDELVYSLYAGDNLFSRTVGCRWAKGFVYPEEEGKEVTVCVYPIYESGVSHRPVFYYGNYEYICKDVITNNIVMFILGLLSIILGVIFIIFVLVNFKMPGLDRSIAYLGMFAMSVGFWKLTDMPSATLIVNNPNLLSAIAISSVCMMVPPFTVFMCGQFKGLYRKAWETLTLFEVAGCIVIAMLQLLDIADLRETLIGSHFIVGIMVMGSLIMLGIGYKKIGVSRRIHITLMCCGLCIVGSVIDITVFYILGNSGDMVCGLVAFLIYVVLMGCISLKEAQQLIEQGKDAERYRKLAMYDQLTGLYNRVYYSTYFQNEDALNEECYIVMMDVNNLKVCNDTMGHNEGDKLLIRAAHFIKLAFDEEDKCIRMGGDEFCVIRPRSTKESCCKCLKQFDLLINNFNSDNPKEFPVNVAYGYAGFDREIDMDLSDTLKRADKAMYQMKLDMKSKE